MLSTVRHVGLAGDGGEAKASWRVAKDECSPVNPGDSVDARVVGVAKASDSEAPDRATT